MYRIRVLDPATREREHDIWEALTGDHHFEQAGFIALLK